MRGLRHTHTRGNLKRSRQCHETVLPAHILDQSALHSPGAVLRVEHVVEGHQIVVQEAGHGERLEDGAGLVGGVDRREGVRELIANGHDGENISSARIRDEEISASGSGLSNGLHQGLPPNLLHIHIDGQNDLAALPRSLHDDPLPRDRLARVIHRLNGLAHGPPENVVVRLLDTPKRLASPHGPEKTPGQVTLGIEPAVLGLEVNARNVVECFTHRGRKGPLEDPPAFRRRRGGAYDLLIQPESLDQETCHRLHVSELPRGDAHLEVLATDGQLDTRAVDHRPPNRGDLHTGVVLARRLRSPEGALGDLYLGGPGDDQASTQQPAREKHPPTDLHPGVDRALSAPHWAPPGSRTISEASGWCMPRCSWANDEIRGPLARP